ATCRPIRTAGPVETIAVREDRHVAAVVAPISKRIPITAEPLDTSALPAQVASTGHAAVAVAPAQRDKRCALVFATTFRTTRATVAHHVTRKWFADSSRLAQAVGASLWTHLHLNNRQAPAPLGFGVDAT